ncbi:MAG TPA: phosphotransferase [Mycobacteriales bacterium]|nr:phosphotransferase [Mycobacteriales bacterium]
MTDHIAAAVRAWSGLVGAWSSRDIGYTSDRVWEIVAASGTAFVLKRNDSSVRQLVAEARILAHLSRNGVPVAVPIPSDDGRIAVRTDDGIFTLAPKLPAGSGDDHYDALEHFHIGVTMARMHVALANCPYSIESPVVDLGLDTGVWRVLRARLAPDVFAGWAERIRPWSGRIDAALDDPHRQRVHGDMHGGNILLGDDHTVSGIVDVDKLPVAPRIYDLGYNLMFSIEWAFQHDEPSGVIERHLMVKARELVRGYQTVSPLTEREIDALPAMALLTAVRLTHWFLSTENSVRDTWLNTAIWITDHAEVLRPG